MSVVLCFLSTRAILTTRDRQAQLAHVLKPIPVIYRSYPHYIADNHSFLSTTFVWKFLRCMVMIFVWLGLSPELFRERELLVYLFVLVFICIKTNTYIYKIVRNYTLGDTYIYTSLPNCLCLQINENYYLLVQSWPYWGVLGKRASLQSSHPKVLRLYK